jgi:squalene-associated FAD-dependent desaturase
MPGTVHVVGAGLAGLSAAVALSNSGRRIVLHEAAQAAGGRCRSFFDRELGCRIDNGNHLLLSGNQAALAYLETIGGMAAMACPQQAEFPFRDLRTNTSWTLRPGDGRLPLWILDGSRRVPESGPLDYLKVTRLRFAGPEARVADLLDTRDPLFRRLWGPLVVAALNTEPAAASARCFWAVLRETLGRGGAACRPLVARKGLSEALVDPALAHLQRNGHALCLGRRLRALDLAGKQVRSLRFTDADVGLGPEDAVVLAAPAPVAQGLVPGLAAPCEFRAILNLHFRHPARLPPPGFLGLVGGLAEWVFARDGLVSVTVSAADRHLDREPLELARHIWRDVAHALGVGEHPLPQWRMIKERRATFAATPAQLGRRPGARTAWRNLVLAGDWTATGLPATIEGAIRSGRRAADEVLALSA